jgi:hypothetical protein
MIYVFEFLKLVDRRPEPVVSHVVTRVLGGDNAARAHAFRILPAAVRDGVFGCRVLREDASIVATVISGSRDS